MAKRFKPRSEESNPEEEKQVKKPSKITGKMKVKKSVQTKLVTYFVWGILIIFFAVAFYFITHVNSFINNQKQLLERIEFQDEKITSLSKNGESSGNFDVFNRAFIVAFYDTKEDQLKYKETLEPYFPKDTQIPINDPDKTAKKITSIQQWETKKEKNLHHVKYLVQYQLNDQSQRELICYNVKEKNGKYVVQSIPYKKKPESMNNNKILNAPEIPTRQDEQVNTEKKIEVRNWLDKTFFPKFVETEDKSLVKYMMKEPEVLGGATDYVGIKDFALYANQDSLEGYVLVEVSDNGTGQVYVNCYQIWISKDEKGQFFIDKLLHQFE